MAVRALRHRPCELFLKLESQNPGGSIKDRIGLSMIEAAERDGHAQARRHAGRGHRRQHRPGPGAGRAAQKGYRLMLVVPDKMSQEKIFHLKALGAEVVLTRSDVGKGHPEYYQDMAERLARETPGALFVNQFGNPANPLAHEATTGAGDLGADGGTARRVVCGVGSGGTLTGLSRFFARIAPADRDGAGRPGGLDPRRLHQRPASSRQGRLVAGRRHRRGLRAADRRPLARDEGLHDSATRRASAPRASC